MRQVQIGLHARSPSISGLPAPIAWTVWLVVIKINSIGDRYEYKFVQLATMALATLFWSWLLILRAKYTTFLQYVFFFFCIVLYLVRLALGDGPASS
jgi:hypothetical protein